MFRSCFVEVVQHSNDLLMNLWGTKWSPRPIPPPSWDRLPNSHVLFTTSTTWEAHLSVCVCVCVCVCRYIFFPSGASGKEPTSQAEDQRDADLNPGLGRSPGEGNIFSIYFSIVSYHKILNTVPCTISDQIRSDQISRVRLFATP